MSFICARIDVEGSMAVSGKSVEPDTAITRSAKIIGQEAGCSPVLGSFPVAHASPATKVLEAFCCDSSVGLSAQDAAGRLAAIGPNRLKEARKKPAYLLFLAQFKEPVVLLLIAAGLITLVIGEHLDSAAIFAIVVLNAIFGFVQEYRAEKAIEALKKMIAPHSRVLRGGVVQIVDSGGLVPGDIVLLEAGDQVPADCRLVSSQMLSTVESALTGESSAVSKAAEGVFPAKALVADRKNMVFMGTSVARGSAVAVVAATGMSTEFGTIAGEVQSLQEEPTPLENKLDELGKKLSIVAVVLVVLIFATGLFKGFELFPMFLTAVSLAVAAIPEGLPAIVTITLALGIQSMAKRNAIIRKLHAVETLGSADVICTDKTGTLTKNEMTVRSIYFNGDEISVAGSGYDLTGGFSGPHGPIDPAKDVQLSNLLRAGALCSTAELSVEDGQAKPVGDGTEVSLLVAAQKAGISRREEAKRFVSVGSFPFESERKAMSSIHVNHSSSGLPGKYVVFCKGAPEVILVNASTAYWGDELSPMTEGLRKSLSLKAEEFAARGLRVLAFGVKTSNSSSFSSVEAAETELVFLGFVAMNDPPREQVKAALALCRTAGIRVVMITGDGPRTAEAIAREIGIDVNGGTMTGADVEELSDSELAESLESCSVIARVSPVHKLRIVSALKANGHIVAMTGDGVNDAPALKKADIGVAMGVAGTDVSKEASDMVLADDNFATIVSAVGQGRTIYDNILKSVRYLLSCNAGELMAVFGATLIGMPMPLIPIQILWMNFVTDGLPALALGMEPPEPDVMSRPPRPSNENILSDRNLLHLLVSGLFMAIVTLAVFSYYLGSQTAQEVKKAETMAFCTIVFLQFAHAFNSRSRFHSVTRLGIFSNLVLVASVVFGIVLQVAIVQSSVLETIFGTVPLSFYDWQVVVAASASILVLYELWKAFKNQLPTIA